MLYQIPHLIFRILLPYCLYLFDLFFQNDKNMYNNYLDDQLLKINKLND